MQRRGEISPKVVKEWQSATKKKLPEKVAMHPAIYSAFVDELTKIAKLPSELKRELAETGALGDPKAKYPPKGWALLQHRESMQREGKKRAKQIAKGKKPGASGLQRVLGRIAEAEPAVRKVVKKVPVVSTITGIEPKYVRAGVKAVTRGKG
jgi:hypothetical protein